jgi:hypothetical protein
MWSGEPGVTRLLVAPGRKVRDAHRQAVTYYVPRANWKRPSRNRDGQREGRPDFAPAKIETLTQRHTDRSAR